MHETDLQFSAFLLDESYLVTRVNPAKYCSVPLAGHNIPEIAE